MNNFITITHTDPLSLVKHLLPQDSSNPKSFQGLKLRNENATGLTLVWSLWEMVNQPMISKTFECF